MFMYFIGTDVGEAGPEDVSPFRQEIGHNIVTFVVFPELSCHVCG